MTDEQIKQNAEKYADKLYEDGRCTESTAPTIQEIHIVGAHSRDEEIGRMNTTIRLYANQIAQQRKEMEQLRNPWRDAKNDPPKDEQQVYVSWGDCNVKGIGIFCQDEKCWQVGWLGSDVEVNYWMPIPELQKGGEQ